MQASELVAQVPNFDALSVPEKIKLFAWHLHVHQKKNQYEKSEIKQCFPATSTSLVLI